MPRVVIATGPVKARPTGLLLGLGAPPGGRRARTRWVIGFFLGVGDNGRRRATLS